MLGVPKMGSEASFVVNTMYNDKSIMGCRYGSARPYYGPQSAVSSSGSPRTTGAPDAADSAITGYTTKQLEWVEENEGNAWGYVIKNENLYSIEPHVIQTYIGESPFTQGMPQESPGNLGQWLGWRIVQQYAQKNEELTLQQLLQTPAKTIFEGAQYRPK